MRRELVIDAMHNNNPARMPLLYFNGAREKSDILLVDVVDHHIPAAAGEQSEWGFRWEQRDDGTMGQVTTPLLDAGTPLSAVPVPDPHAPGRYRHLEATVRKYGSDRYFIASLGLSGFTIMTFLKGFTQVLTELMLDSEEIHELADIVFNFEEELISELPGYGFDGIAFFDDWGMQESMIISPELWRSFFLPRYAKEFGLAHSLGLTVYFHSCGFIGPIVRDLISAGVDFLNLSQPNLYDFEEIGEKYAGKVCFVEPVSYQTTSLEGDRNAIRNAVSNIIGCLGANGGGVIGYLEEYESIGLSRESYLECEKAFTELGAYEAT